MEWARLGFLAICLHAHVLTAQTAAIRERVVKVDGRQVHVSIAGAGQAAVVFEAGFVNDLRSWAKVQPEIAKFCTTQSYDRAGIGESEASASPRSGEQIARELHALLLQAGVMPPYVLVGHSAGGLYIRSFAHLYPEQVSGMVFVDAVLPEYLRWLQANDREHWHDLEQIRTESGDVVRAQWLGLEPTLREVEDEAALPQVPVAILVSDQADLPFKPPAAMEAFLRTQREFAAQVPGSKIEIIAAGHELPTLTPQKVSAAIRGVLQRVKLSSH
jgi:pimeloyl-ACP methyl ester carboxylesterase